MNSWNKAYLEFKNNKESLEFINPRLLLPSEEDKGLDLDLADSPAPSEEKGPLTKPRYPEPEECCNTGCTDCVYTVYYNRLELASRGWWLEEYRQQLMMLEESGDEEGGDQSV